MSPTEPPLVRVPEVLTFRPLQESDIDAGFRDSLESLCPARAPTPQISTSLFIRKNTRHHTYVACLDGKVVGTASLLIETKLSRDCRPAGHIEDVAIHPDYHGRGIGLKLVEHLLLMARSNGCYKVILDCDEETAPFYEKAGFYVNGVAMRYDVE